MSINKQSVGSVREPPYSMAYEQALLAACMLEGGQDSIAKCIDLKLSADSFYIPAHQKIFEACIALFKAGSPVNLVTVGEQLKGMGALERIGGLVYLNELSDRIESPAGLAFYAQSVKNLEVARNLVRFFLTGLEEAYQVRDVDQFIEHVESRVFEINQGRVEETVLPFEGSVDKAVNLMQKLSENQEVVNGVASGFKDLDQLTTGFHGAEMIVIAARPSMGKTALALNIAEAALMRVNPVPTLFFSLEMSAEQLAMRMIGSCGRIDMTKLRTGFLSKSRQASIGQIGEALKHVPLWIDESSNLTILELRSKARRLHAQHPLGLIIVDYLQLLAGTDSKVSREQQIAEISRGIKSMAKELNVPVIVLSQLNREMERENRQPRLSDLRESGSIEQDADLVLLLSKADKETSGAEKPSQALEEVVPPTNEPLTDVVRRDLILAKQRNGPIGVVPLVFFRAYTRFESFVSDKKI